MVEEEDNDSFLKEFLARAQKRQAKLAQIGQPVKSDEREDVSYPALSPLPEEDSITPAGESVTEQEDTINTVDRAENLSPAPSDALNYSSDLSLECETEELYRAEPAVCKASPEHPVAPPPKPYLSPRKHTIAHYVQPQQPHAAQLAVQELATPLQEIQPSSDQKPTSSQSLPSTSAVEQIIKELDQKLDRAELTRAQLKKAVEMAKHGSKEHVEAARLLQIAELEHLNLTNHIAMFKQGLRKKTEGLGSVAIHNIKLKISPKFRNELAEDGVSHHFFCTAFISAPLHGGEIKVTKLVNTNDIRKQDLKTYVQFKDTLAFTDLPPDFIVKLEVFELVISSQLPKFLSRLTPSKRTKITPELTFKRVGSLKLTLADRDISHKNLFQWGEQEKSSYIERECRFTMELKPEQLPVKSGMLHVRCLDTDGRPDWSRYWVDSSCGQLRFWKSRQDALDGKKPNLILEFNSICSERVQKLTPDDALYRQHSFVLYSYQQLAGGEGSTLLQKTLKDDPTYKVEKHQLAADSKEDRDSWSHVLDKSFHTFREWYGNTKLYSVDELKDIFSD